MSNTPCASVKTRRKHVETWVNSQWKNPARPGQSSAGINIPTADTAFTRYYAVVSAEWI
jgi:hypothetical protein